MMYISDLPVKSMHDTSNSRYRKVRAMLTLIDYDAVAALFSAMGLSWTTKSGERVVLFLPISITAAFPIASVDFVRELPNCFMSFPPRMHNELSSACICKTQLQNQAALVPLC